MRLTSFLNRRQVEDIHRNALRVLAEVGVRVEHDGVAARLRSIGGECAQSDLSGGTVTFSPKVVEGLIMSAPKNALQGTEPRVTIGTGVYQCYYLDPADNSLKPFDEETLGRYLAFAKTACGSAECWVLGAGKDEPLPSPPPQGEGAGSVPPSPREGARGRLSAIRNPQSEMAGGLDSPTIQPSSHQAITPPATNINLLGLPFIPEGISARLLPLAERLYAWKNGVQPGGSVHFTEMCEPLLEMWRCHAAYAGKPVTEVFQAGGYLISPLKLARPECEQILFFADQGLKMYIGHLPSQGGSAPVSLAGSLVLALAEQIFLFLLRRCLWEDVGFHLESQVSTIDMASGMLCYGRPEQVRAVMAFADIADFYGCECWGHTGCSDAKLPSVEAGAQKAAGALMTALATGHGYIEAGLLGTDEICSPVQMLLDLDLADSLNKMLQNPVTDDIESAFDEIASAGFSGNHLGTDFTAERFRKDLHHPQTWSNQPLSSWLSSGRQTDVDKASEIVAEFESHYSPERFISEDEERDLRGIIRAT